MSCLLGRHGVHLTRQGVVYPTSHARKFRSRVPAPGRPGWT